VFTDTHTHCLNPPRPPPETRDIISLMRFVRGVVRKTLESYTYTSHSYKEDSLTQTGRKCNLIQETKIHNIYIFAVPFLHVKTTQRYVVWWIDGKPFNPFCYKSSQTHTHTHTQTQKDHTNNIKTRLEETWNLYKKMRTSERTNQLIVLKHSRTFHYQVPNVTNSQNKTRKDKTNNIKCLVVDGRKGKNKR